jgi:hypothetical protein
VYQQEGLLTNIETLVSAVTALIATEPEYTYITNSILMVYSKLTPNQYPWIKVEMK